jgi:hypothetical protein
MRRTSISIATALLFTGLLSACASPGVILGRTVPGGFGAVVHAPSAFDCQAGGANDDVFARQCASNISNAGG